jgi:hypothetical protein
MTQSVRGHSRRNKREGRAGVIGNDPTIKTVKNVDATFRDCYVAVVNKNLSLLLANALLNGAAVGF